MRNKRYGRCCICGTNGELSEEHVPPSKAFNDKQVFWYKMKQEAESNKYYWREKKNQRGSTRYSLCGKCNKFTGRKYGTAYKYFTVRAAEYAKEENAGQRIPIEFKNIYLSRIVKQALSIINRLIIETSSYSILC